MPRRPIGAPRSCAAASRARPSSSSSSSSRGAMADSEQSSEPKADEPKAPPPPATLGERLRAARLSQDLTVEQLSTELRIEAKQLHALENNRFEQIGVPVFI